MLITRLLLILEVWDGKPTYRKSWAGNLLVWSDLTLGPLFKIKRGQLNLTVLITHLLWGGHIIFDLTLGPLVQGQMRIAKLKSVYNSLIIGSRGSGWQTNLWEIMDWESSGMVGYDLGLPLQG